MKSMLVLFSAAMLLAAVHLFAASQAAILQSGIINSNAPYPECHASTIIELSPGKLGAAWFGGTKERNPDVGIWFARHENVGKIWTGWKRTFARRDPAEHLGLPRRRPAGRLSHETRRGSPDLVEGWRQDVERAKPREKKPALPGIASSLRASQ